MDCPYTFMHDMVNGRFVLPWEAEVVHVDGTSCGFVPPTRRHDPSNMVPDAAGASLSSVRKAA
jgi:formamidase